MLAVALPLSLGGVPAAASTTAPPPTGPAAGSAARTVTLTLVTGDTVTVTTGPNSVVSVAPQAGEGREDISFSTRSDGPGDISVFPSDALPLIANGSLDARLFDVDRLIEYGYDDAQQADLPLIVEHPRGTAGGPALGRLLPAARVTRDLTRLRMTGMRTGKAERKTFWRQLTANGRLRSGVSRVWLDGQTRVTLDRSVPQIGAPTAWKSGWTGKGVTVAMLDSGYDSDHPMLAGRVALAQDFTGVGSAEDDHGHGTHVLSTIGGATDGTLRGVAPDARLVVGKICTAAGSCPDSATLAGMEWAVTTAGAKVVNMSIGGPDQPGVDPVERAINELSAQTGALFVVAAGNSGEDGLSTVESPGTADAALSVGAVDRSDKLAYFSSRGSRVGDHAVKPEITAPGVDIVAARLGGGSVAMSGTSMATPHVAGAAALLAQRFPTWTGVQLKAALIGAATPTAGLNPYQQGSGRVDVARAVAQPVTVSPANLTAVAGWERTPGAEKSHELTYNNDGDAPVTLGLTVDTPSSPGGQPGNPALFTLDRQSVTVPAHGTATVTVTVHDVMPRGTQAAVLTAATADGAISVRSLLGDHTPVPSWRLTTTAIDRAGQPARGTVQLIDRYGDATYFLYLSGGTATQTVPEGQYWAVQVISTPAPASSNSLVVVPVTVDADRTVTLDARTANPVDVRVADPEAEGVSLVAGVALPVADGTREFSAMAGRAADFARVYVAPVADPDASYRAHATFARKGASSTAPSPFFYHVIDKRTGGVPADLSYRTGREGLTRVTVDYRAQGTASGGDSGAVPADEHPMAIFDQPVAFPSTVVDWRTPGAWNDRIRLAGRMPAEITPRTYGPGQDNRLVWNGAVLGPNMGLDALARLGDNMGLHNWNGVQWLISGNEGETGFDWGAEGFLDLSRDGRLIKRWNAIGLYQSGTVVPADEGAYSLHGVLTRNRPYAGLSTRVECEWTFRSATSNEVTVLPLLGVRAEVKGLDLSNYAVAASTSQLTVTVQRSPGAAPSPTTLTGLEVSYDDGATWTRVEVEDGTAKVKNPRTDGFVSLRATAADAAGSTVRQTILRAYGVRVP